jgi:heme exporter protein C
MDAKPRFLSILDGLTAVMFVIATALVFFYVPTELIMGQVQRIFYFHVAAAWVGMLGFLVAAVAGVIFLRSANHQWDIMGMAAVEISVVFLFVAIVMGSIWARPVWNTWWTWDPRLTTASIMELIYAAYLMLRAGIEDTDRRARFGAVYAILGFVSVPLTFLSIRIFRTIHPVVVGNADPNATGQFDMSPKMLQAFLFSLLTFTMLFVDLLWHRIRLGRLSDRLEQLRMKLAE